MLSVEFSPWRTFKKEHFLDYEFGENHIKVIAGDGSEEVYDFDDLSEGCTINPQDIDEGVLPMKPLFKVKVENGVTKIRLTITHGRDAPEEVKFPNNPYTVEEAISLLDLNRDHFFAEDKEVEEED